MDPRRFDAATRSLAAGASRRRALGGLATALLTVAGGRAPEAMAAKKRRRRVRRNAFGCVNVGGFCRNAGQCCSGICRGKKGKKRCRGARHGRVPGRAGTHGLRRRGHPLHVAHRRNGTLPDDDGERRLLRGDGAVLPVRAGRRLPAVLRPGGRVYTSSAPRGAPRSPHASGRRAIPATSRDGSHATGGGDGRVRVRSGGAGRGRARHAPVGAAGRPRRGGVGRRRRTTPGSARSKAGAAARRALGQACGANKQCCPDKTNRICFVKNNDMTERCAAAAPWGRAATRRADCCNGFGCEGGSCRPQA